MYAWLYVLLYTIVDFKSSLELVLYVRFISTLNKALNWIELNWPVKPLQRFPRTWICYKKHIKKTANYLSPELFLPFMKEEVTHINSLSFITLFVHLSLCSFGHCIVCILSNYGFWLPFLVSSNFPYMCPTSNISVYNSVH